jgi:hypothetical protein
MTATPTADQLQAMVGPGQGDVFDQFMEDLSQQDAEIAAAEERQGERPEPVEEEPGEQLLAGKFKSPAELEKAYKELESKLGQRGQQAEPEPEQQPSLTPDQYTPELGKQLYGDTVATAIEAAEINPLEMAEKVYAGQDVSSYVDALVEKGGLPREVVETYLQGVAPAKGNNPAPPDSSAGFSEADVTELKAMVGGDEQFQQLSQWAVANLDPQELADYNAAVDSGNKAAARFALRQLQVRATAGQGGEPKLISGGAPANTDVFKSQQDAIEAMRKTNSKGKRLYNVDPKYRSWFEKTLARSTFE